MFNYNINWSKIIKENLPSFFHTIFRIDWITALIKPVKIIYADFQASQVDAIYKVAYTGQVIYMERILNEIFDPIDRGIYIEGLVILNDHYLYRKSESKPPFYLYRKWDSAFNYVALDFATEGNSVYQSLTSNTNILPSSSPTDWEYKREVSFIYRDVDFSAVSGFIVYVPSSLVFDEARMIALINYYRFATMSYTINLY